MRSSNARIVKASSHPNEVFLDPFLGSGTVAAVALSLQRCVIGAEIRQDYCDIAASRIDNFLRQKQPREIWNEWVLFY
ncbi:MAG: site-specific DNA-methyltransferase [Oscillatoria sp. Prado101]|nr:site-specific DNA-methyltransferase [Oscillatoria sp. Prado101]